MCILLYSFKINCTYSFAIRHTLQEKKQKNKNKNKNSGAKGENGKIRKAYIQKKKKKKRRKREEYRLISSPEEEEEEEEPEQIGVRD